jgi:hypothetical protein
MKGRGNSSWLLIPVLGLVLAAFVLLAPVHAKANEPVTIVLVANHADAEIIPLLRAELGTLGLNVLVVDRGDHELSPSELTEAARRNHAFAAFRVLVAEGKVEVWLADRVTGKVLLREVLKAQSQPSATGDRTVVARAVELLRASLLELDVDERPQGEVAPPKSLPKAFLPPRPQSPRPEDMAHTGIAINTSFVVLGASLGVGPSPGLGVALRWQAAPNWAVVGRLASPIVGPEYSIAQGHTQLSPRLGAASLRWSSNAFNGGFHAALEAGMGVLWTRAVGVGATNYTGFVASDIDPVPFLGGELNYNATRSIAFALGLLGGPGLRPTRYVFAESSAQEVFIGRYGSWVALASLGLDVAWN